MIIVKIYLGEKKKESIYNEYCNKKDKKHSGGNQE